MKKSAAVFASVMVLALSGRVLAAEMAAPKPIVVKDEVTVKAAVVAIDRENRTVDLKGPQGNVVTLVVDESVTRFDSMKVGDMVTAHYFESVAYDIQKPGTPAAPDTITQGGGKFTGAKPGGAIAAKTVTTVTITAIDKATPAVTVRTSDGAIKNYRVRHPEYLDKVKVGDQVQVTQTAALMIAVEAAK
jgi:hypothetical protein